MKLKSSRFKDGIATFQVNLESASNSWNENCNLMEEFCSNHLSSKTNANSILSSLLSFNELEFSIYELKFAYVVLKYNDPEEVLWCSKCQVDFKKSNGKKKCPQCQELVLPKIELFENVQALKKMNEIIASFNRSLTYKNTQAKPNHPKQNTTILISPQLHQILQETKLAKKSRSYDAVIQENALKILSLPKMDVPSSFLIDNSKQLCISKHSLELLKDVTEKSAYTNYYEVLYAICYD